ncbi:hypothetical protein [Noviherbaspirillum galbum]|uniref:Uncharacterized protein n=1 Tax=Noviherbaspirillum galbum TaxID=2709383 RepID=A0A6B3SH21_9BURK|nr:hypothetical protein [Noviherbaspirillum galbum]NEX60144.1 hypothetical protein [Noviherbaspirillum galbum]
MFTMRFLDGSPVPQQYLDQVTALTQAAVRAEQRVDGDELEAYSLTMRRRLIAEAHMMDFDFGLGAEVIRAARGWQNTDSSLWFHRVHVVHADGGRQQLQFNVQFQYGDVTVAEAYTINAEVTTIHRAREVA